MLLDTREKKIYNGVMADETIQEPQGPAPTQQGEDEGGGSGIMGPEGFMMMLIAGTIDSVGIILLFFGLDDFGITDFIAYSTIGLWMLMRGSGFKKPTSGKEQTTKKATKMAKRLKWLKPLAFIGELIPYVGALPLWSFMVYSELQS
jgi:hypothetical protein